MIIKWFLEVWLCSGIKYLFANLWVLWEFGLDLHLGNSQPCLPSWNFGSILYKQIRELVFGSRMGVKDVDTRNLKGLNFPHSGLTFY